ncbi:uncharacterized protein [Epargyreus clarus]|uniref:uncharacterized protein n=1 Tax=Epargyreus clarus TaxID=520877 RepID=UPI003C2CA1A4
MKNLILLVSVLVVCLRVNNVIALNLPGPRVYVVTPSPRPFQIDKGRSVPFYYHNWMRRMDNDVAQNATTTTTTPKVLTPDLIFAEFASDSNDSMKKSIRKLLEKEKVVTQTTTTTFRPIYVPDEELDNANRAVNYGLPIKEKEEEKTESKTSGPVDYFSLYNKMYEDKPSPVFMPFTTQSTTTTTTATPTTTPETNKVESVWHIIDSEKINKYSGDWDEVPTDTHEETQVEDKLLDQDKTTERNGGGDDEINENFALPGFGTNPGNGAENESRAIRTEPNMRFPYVNLKPFQLKPSKRPFDNLDTKKTNNLMTSLNNFYELKNPVRGEVQDVVPMREAIERYNPAQPYLPPTDYGSKYSKQNSGPTSTLPKATANLVPPPPPPAPKLTDSDFPAPTSYESFPPYAAPSFDPAPPPPAPKPSVSMLSPPTVDTSDDSDSYSDNIPNNKPPMDIGYRYKPPSPPVQKFVPTLPPISKPFNGYSYDKPPMAADSPMMPAMDDKPDFHGYHYNKPDDFYHHHHHHPTTTTTTTEMPRVNRYSYYYLGKKLYYLPLYFSVYFIVYVGALIIKAVLRHKIVYPNSWRPNGTTASFFSKRSVDSYLSNDNLHEVTGRVTRAIATAAEKYLSHKSKNE